MKKPENLESFVTIIDNMLHRERFVFEAKDATNQKYNQKCYIEIYNTILFENKNMERNITVHLVSQTGEVLNKKAKMHRLWNKEFYSSVYNMFKSEVLELSE